MYSVKIGLILCISQIIIKGISWHYQEYCSLIMAAILIVKETAVIKENLHLFVGN